jgi:hypothetical protein
VCVCVCVWGEGVHGCVWVLGERVTEWVGSGDGSVGERGAVEHAAPGLESATGGWGWQVGRVRTAATRPRRPAARRPPPAPPPAGTRAAARCASRWRCSTCWSRHTARRRRARATPPRGPPCTAARTCTRGGVEGRSAQVGGAPAMDAPGHEGPDRGAGRARHQRQPAGRAAVLRPRERHMKRRGQMLRTPSCPHPCGQRAAALSERSCRPLAGPRARAHLNCMSCRSPP